MSGRCPGAAGRRVARLAAIVATAAAACTSGLAPRLALAQAPAPAGALLIPINLMCTTCDDFIRCTRTGAVPPGPGARVPAVVYRLKEKTFWAQVATIGDYLVQLFRPKTTDERPFAIYRDDGRAYRIEQGGDARATIDSQAALIGFPDARIDQRNGAWTDLRGQAVGSCAPIRRRDGYALVREILGKPAPGAAAGPTTARGAP